MSRIGKKIISIPEKVKVKLTDGIVFIEGPLGKDQFVLSPRITIETDGKQLNVKRQDESQESRQIHGATRAILQNMVTGLSTGFQKILEINGVGYRAEVKGNEMHMTLGYSHPVVFPIPQGIKVAVEKQTRVTISGSSKDLVGQVSANVRSLRAPEPYKGKGIKYDNEVIQRKVGKAAASAGGGK